MAFTVVPMRRNSPLTGWPSSSSAIFCVRSPPATAPSTRATSVVGCTRSPISELMEPMLSAHPPFTGPSAARSAICPSRPTTRSTRTSSSCMRWFMATMALKARAISSMARGWASSGSRTEKSPWVTACSDSSRTSRAFPVVLRRGRACACRGSVED